jgi:hypothetical protein
VTGASAGLLAGVSAGLQPTKLAAAMTAASGTANRVQAFVRLQKLFCMFFISQMFSSF